jgi:hypothetical protein
MGLDHAVAEFTQAYRDTWLSSPHGINRRHREVLFGLFQAALWICFDTATGYFGTAFCFSRPHRTLTSGASNLVARQSGL